MDKNPNYSFKQTKNGKDKYWEVFKHFESISKREHSAFQELLDFTLKNNTNLNKKK